MTQSCTEETIGLRHGGFSYTCRVQRTASDRLPLFFVSGAFQSMVSWRKFADHFGRSTTVIRCDLPGTGGSDVLPATYGMDFLAAAIHAVLRRLGIPRCDIFSASYGSPIAYRFAQLFPDAVGGLILGGVMKEIPGDRRAMTVRSMATLCEGRLRDFARDVADGLLCTDERRPIERRHVVRRLLMTQLERLTPSDQLRYVHNTTRLLDHAPLDLTSAPQVPTLVFTGEHDVYTRPDDCREVALAFDDAVFTTIERADHLCHLERFEATLALVDGFLRRPTASRGSRPCHPTAPFASGHP